MRRVMRWAVGTSIVGGLMLPLAAASESVVSIAPGVYSMQQIVNRSGNADQWVRFRPQVPGTVTIRGGGEIAAQYVVLDGFLFDSRLHPRFPSESAAFIISGSNVEVANSELRGPSDVHTGFDANNNVSCGESDGFPGNGGAFFITGQNVSLVNVLVHGYYGAGSFGAGSTVRVTSSIFRNNFNGLTMSGAQAYIADSVMWVHPNHLNSMGNATGGSVTLVNNLIVDAQEMIAAGVPGWDGVDHLQIIHNTFYIPANKPCYDFDGMQLAYVRRSLTIKDNIVVNGRNFWLDVARETERLDSDHNLFYHHDTTASEEFRLGPKASSDRQKYQFAGWQQVTGDDDRRSLYRQRPLFENAPSYADTSANQWGFRVPLSAAEARAWFRLRNDSPGRNGASDGLDIGITTANIAVTPNFTPFLRPPQNLRIVP